MTPGEIPDDFGTSSTRYGKPHEKRKLLGSPGLCICYQFLICFSRETTIPSGILLCRLGAPFRGLREATTCRLALQTTSEIRAAAEVFIYKPF